MNRETIYLGAIILAGLAALGWMAWKDYKRRRADERVEAHKLMKRGFRRVGDSGWVKRG